MKNESILMKIFTILLLISCTVKAQENANPFTSLLTETKKNETLSPDAASLTNRPSPAFPVFTRIFNAFPPSASDGSLLSLLLDEDKIEGVGYGEALEKETVMHAAEDFVLDFKNPTTGVVVNYGAPDYGYIEGGVTMENEVVVIVRRDQRNPDRPAHDIKKFSKDLGSETSKIYFYNAIWSNNTNILGINCYKVNTKTGQLNEMVSGLLMGEGREIDVPPGKPIKIKASHADLRVSYDPELAHTVEIELLTVPGQRHYVVVCGDQATRDTKAAVMGPAGTASISGGSYSHYEPSHITVLSVLASLSLTQTVVGLRKWFEQHYGHCNVM